MTTDELQLQDLKYFIQKNDKEKVITLMECMKAECVTSETLYILIVTPSVITELHKLLIDHMGVQPRAMKLKNRVINTRRRAIMFLQAMINGVNISNV